MVKPEPAEYFTDPDSGLTPERLAKCGHAYVCIDSNCWAAQEYDTLKILAAYGLPVESLKAYTTGDICNFSHTDVPFPLHLLYVYKQLTPLQLIPLAPGPPALMSHSAVLTANGWSPALTEEDFTWPLSAHQWPCSGHSPPQNSHRLGVGVWVGQV